MLKLRHNPTLFPCKKKGGGSCLTHMPKTTILRKACLPRWHQRLGLERVPMAPEVTRAIYCAWIICANNVAFPSGTWQAGGPTRPAPSQRPWASQGRSSRHGAVLPSLEDKGALCDPSREGEHRGNLNTDASRPRQHLFPLRSFYCIRAVSLSHNYNSVMRPLSLSQSPV